MIFLHKNIIIKLDMYVSKINFTKIEHISQFS